MRSFIPLAPALLGALVHGAKVPPLHDPDQESFPPFDPAQETFTESSSTLSLSAFPSTFTVTPSSSRFPFSSSFPFSASSTALPAVPSSSDILSPSVPSGVPTESSTPGETLPSNTPSDVPSGSGIPSDAPSTGPSLAPSPAPSTTPMTTYPPITVSISTVSGATTNGHTTTTGPNNQPTLLPIIAPHCWFCPPGDNGWGLGGMTAPGVYPPGPPPPGWPSPLPPITIGPEGNPTYPSTEPTTDPTTEPTTSQTTSSSSSCTTETTSSCTVSTSYGVDTAGSTTTTFSTTSCSTFSGCSVTGTTSTTVTTSSAPGCWKFPTAYAYATPAPSFARREVGSALEVDTIDGPAYEALLEKRGGKKGGKKGNRHMLNSLGNCALKKTIKVPGNDYPGPGKIESFMQKASIPFPGAYIVPQEDTSKVCAPPQLTLLSDVSKLSSTKYYDGTNYVPMGTEIAGKVPYVNTEHVYELKTLPYFFAYLHDSGKISCDDLNSALFPQSGQNYANELWSRLPSNKYPAFIALDNTVNNIKGEMLSQNFPLGNGKSNLDDEMAYLFNMAMVFEMMRNGQITQWYQKTNALLYEFMRDTLDTSCSSPKPAGGFASAYSSWMEEHIQTQAASASTAMTNRYAQATARPNINPSQKGMLGVMTRRYPMASWTFDNSDFLSWPAAPGLGKRTACTKTTTSTSGSSGSPTNPTGAPGGPHSGAPHSGGPTSTALHPSTRPQPSSGTAPTPTAPPTSSNPTTGSPSSASPYSSSNPSSGPYSSGAPLPSSGAYTSTGLIPSSQSVVSSSVAPSPYSSSYPSPPPYSSGAPLPSSGAYTSTGLIPTSQPAPFSSAQPSPSTFPSQSSPAPPPFTSSVASTFRTSPSQVYTSTPIASPPPPPSTPVPPPVTTQPPPPPPPPTSPMPPSSVFSSVMPSPVYMRRRKIAA